MGGAAVRLDLFVQIELIGELHSPITTYSDTQPVSIGLNILLTADLRNCVLFVSMTSLIFHGSPLLNKLEASI